MPHWRHRYHIQQPSTHWLVDAVIATALSVLACCVGVVAVILIYSVRF